MIAVLCMIVGAVLLVAGVAWLSIPAAVAVAGALLVLLGVDLAS